MRKLVILLILVIAVLIGFRVTENRIHKKAMQEVSWFSGEEQYQLKQDSSGNLTLICARLNLDIRPGKLFAAAFWAKDGVLVTVGKDAEVRLYEGQHFDLKLKKHWNPKRQSTTNKAAFSRIPGLVYMFLIDTAIAKELEMAPMRSMSANYNKRIVLKSSAKNWHAIPIRQDCHPWLEGVYHRDSYKKISLSLHNKEPVQLDLPDPIVEPHEYGQDIPAQAVYVLPDRRILCNVGSGWSLHGKSGRLIKWFKYTGRLGTWSVPTLKNGQIHVDSFYGREYKSYRLDTDTGKYILESKNQ